jgi:streptogramin lyase
MDIVKFSIVNIYKFLTILALIVVVFSCSEETTIINPPQNYGSIVINSNPQGTRIFLLGTNTNKVTPDSIQNLTPGDYEITLKKDGYVDTTLMVNVKSNLRTTLFVNLSISTGTLIVDSYPHEAQIFLDNINTNYLTPHVFNSINFGNRTISINKEGYIGIGTNIYVKQGDTTNYFVTINEYPEYWWTTYNLLQFGFDDRDVFCVAIDNSNNKWMGIGNNGLARFDDNSWIFYNQNNSGISSQYVKQISFDNNNIIWLGTYDGGLCKFDGTNWSTYNVQNSEIPYNRIELLRIDNNNKIWLLALESGVGQSIVNFDGLNFIVYDNTNTPSELLTKEIRDICCTKNGDILIGSAENGMYRFDGSLWTEDNSIYDIRTIFESDNGMIWVVDKDNRIYKGNFGNWEFVAESPGGGRRTIVVENNTIWVGDYTSGVSKFDGERWTNYQGVIQSLLTTSDVEQIVIDRLGNKWIATRRGLLKRK